MHRDDPEQLATARARHAPRRPRDPRAARHRAHREELAHRGARCACSRTTSIPRSPRIRRSSSSTAASAAPRATGSASTRSSRRCASSSDDESLLIQSGKPVGVFKTHADAPRVLIANSNLVPNWATWEHFNELDRKGLMMYGQMTAGLVDLHRQPGHRAGHLRDLRRGRAPALRRRARRQVDPDRGPGRHGRRAAARRDDGRRVDARDRMPADRASRCGCATRYLDRQAKDLDDALAIIARRVRGARSRCRVGLLGNAAEILPELVRRGVRPRHGDRPDVRARSRQRLSAGRLDGRAMAARRRRDPAQHAALVAAAKRSIVSARRGDARLPRAGHPDVRLRQQHPAGRARRGRGQRVRLPGLRARVHPAAVLRGQGAVPLGRAVGRPGGHLQDRPQGRRSSFPDNAHLHRWLDMARERIAFQGLPARICWLGLGERHLRRPRVQRDGGDAAN